MDTVRDNILVRFYFVVLVVVFFLGLIVFKIFRLQYFEGEDLRDLAKATFVEEKVVPANRGNVYASGGDLLATSVTQFDVYMDVMSVDLRVFERDVRSLAKSLSKLLGNTSKYYLTKLRYARMHRNRYLLVAKKVSYADYLKMKTFPIFKLGVYGGGFITEQKTVRVHPIGKIAARTVGYDDHRGEAGIEGAYSEELIGKDGLRLKQKIARGRWKPLRDVNEVEPIDGIDVITTIDVDIQDVVHHALLKRLAHFEAEHGCAIVMEVKTGAIKAIANLGRTRSGKFYEKRNYGVWESHEPGSTFKLATLMVGLEDRVIDTSSMVDCGSGRYYVRGKKVEDSHRGGYGNISMAKAFELSSNIAMVKMVEKHYVKNPQRFIDRINFFGLGKKTGVNIKGEGVPFVPSSKTKRWNSMSLPWMSWGYGVSFTPLQLLAFYNAVANDGELVKPRFVEELRSGDRVSKKMRKVVLNKRIARQSTINKMKAVMENVVKRGTAKKMYSPDFSMAGKTGTAQKWIGRHQGRDGRMVAGHYSNKYYVSSFAGFFPVDNPKYSCIVVVHKPNKDKGYYGADVAGPVFKEIAYKIHTTTPSETKSILLKDVKISRVNRDYANYYKSLQKYKTIMPNVVGMSVMDAVSLLENMSLRVRFDGVGKVIKQSVTRGKKVSKGLTVYLKTS